jgi:hypothetical protein
MSKDSLRTLPLFMVEVVRYADDGVEQTLGPYNQVYAGVVASEYGGLPNVYPAIRRATETELEALPARLRKVVG